MEVFNSHIRKTSNMYWWIGRWCFSIIHLLFLYGVTEPNPAIIVGWRPGTPWTGCQFVKGPQSYTPQRKTPHRTVPARTWWGGEVKVWASLRYDLFHILEFISWIIGAKPKCCVHIFIKCPQQQTSNSLRIWKLKSGAWQYDLHKGSVTQLRYHAPVQGEPKCMEGM